MVWQVNKKAASLALLLTMSGRSLVRAFSWSWSVVNAGSATCPEMLELWLCATQVQLCCCHGQGEPRGNLVVLAERGTSVDPNPVLGWGMPRLWPVCVPAEC